MEKIVKNCIIARSGIYQYLADELISLGLDIKKASELKQVYNVYRPSIVLTDSLKKFSRLPLTIHHPQQKVTTDNFRQLAVGYTDDAVQVDYDNENKEVILKTSLSLMDSEAINNYNNGVIELSPGYDADFKFEKGKTAKGEDYDIVMTNVKDANHLALVEKARGGSSVKILDSKGGKKMSILSGLWRIVKRKIGGVQDADLGNFRQLIEEVVKNRKALSDEDFNSKIENLKSMCSDLPDSNEKEKLIRFLEDFRIVKEKDDAQATEAASMISDLFEKLDTEAMKEAPEKKEEVMKDADEIAKKELNEKEPEQKQEVAKDGDLTNAQALSGSSETKDEPEQNKEYIIQEISTALKKILSMIDGGSKDACSKDESPEEKTEKEEKKEEKKEETKDSMPFFNVSDDAKKTCSKLDDFWKKL